MPGNIDSARHQAAQMLIRSGELSLAEAACRKLLAENESDAAAMDLLGVLLGQQDRHAEAVDHHLGAIRLDPGSAGFLANLGTTLMALERYDEAAKAFSSAIGLEPDQSDLYLDHGLALAALNRHADAMVALRAGIRIDPENPALWISLGRSQHFLGGTSDALQAFRQAAALEPRSAAAHANCGALLSELGEHSSAIEACKLAVSCDPTFVDARLNLAAALLASGAATEAAAAYTDAIAIDPRLPQLHLGLADAFYAMGDHGSSARSLKHVCELDPENVVALCNLGKLKLESGKLSAAEFLYRRALDASPLHGPAWIGLTQSRKFAALDPELQVMASILEQPLPDPRSRIEISFSYAKACDDIGDFDTAGTTLVAANSSARRKFQYDVSDDEKRMRDIEQVVDRNMVDRWATGASTSSRPIFILGMPRSGTTLLEQMVSSHESVHGAGELADLPGLVRRALPADHPRHLAGLEPESVARLGSEYLSAVHRLDSGALHVTDKLNANFQHVGLIAAAFPRAVILHCNRDGLDTCWSCFQNPFIGSQPWSYDLAEIARYYRAYRRLMAHWQRILPGRLCTVRYENLIADPERVLREVLNRCALPWDPACLQFWLNQRPVKTASASQVRQQLYATSIGRARRYWRFLGPLVAGVDDAAEPPRAPPESGCL
jgi:tetratricopeptide (TPR) repeat protein